MTARAFLILCLGFGASALPSGPALADAPPGRSWAPPVLLQRSDLSAFHFGYPLLLHDAAGRPAMLTSVRRGGDPRWTWSVLAWSGTAWADSIVSAEPMGFLPRLAQTTNGMRGVTTISPNVDRDGYFRMLLWSVGSTISAAETVAVTTSQYSSFAYSAAVTEGRRWLARADQLPNLPSTVKTYYSDERGVWKPLPPLGSEEYNCAIAPLGGTEALLVYSGLRGSYWTRLEGTRWGAVQPLPRYTEGPTFLPRKDSGLWLLSSSRIQVFLDKWTGSGWSTEAALSARREPPGRGFVHVGWLEPSQEDGAAPAIAWQENWDEGLAWRSAAHVAWPGTGTWSPGYQVPNSDSMYIGPTVALDRNGDAWVAWACRAGYIRWTHTYVSVTASTPAVRADGKARRVEWDLDASAPGSWWAVLSDDGSGSSKVVARVQAGESTHMSWLESAPNSNRIQYRVRRESEDERFVWTSAPTAVPAVTVGAAPGGGPLRLLSHPNPAGARALLEVRGAEPGPVRIVVHDVSGRAVATFQATAGASGFAELPIDLGAQAHGIYFAIARDARGRSASPLRLVHAGP